VGSSGSLADPLLEHRLEELRRLGLGLLVDLGVVGERQIELLAGLGRLRIR
jgi:hypothetical protein